MSAESDILNELCDLAVDIRWVDVGVTVNGMSIERVAAHGYPYLEFCHGDRVAALGRLLKLIRKDITHARAEIVETAKSRSDHKAFEHERPID